MPMWMVFAFVSMLFAGLTSVIAKQGLTGISGELGLAIRTCFVFGYVLAFASWFVPRAEWMAARGSNWFWLGLSGATTALSWVFYYKALKEGTVTTVALIDKGSLIVAVLLAWLWLGEKITPRIALGCALILAGLLVVSRK